MQFSRPQQLFFELRAFWRGYPEFVYSPRPRPDPASLPVFVYHSIDPIGFEEDLRFLAENRIETLSLSRFLAALTDGQAARTPAVLLTVDDGRSSFWRFGFPLLRKYGARSTLFVMPGWTAEATACRPNLEDVREGVATVDDLVRADPQDRSLCTWPEIAAMARSGQVEVESHSLFHKEVFVRPRIRDFVDAQTPFTAYDSPVTAYLGPRDVGRPLDPEAFRGLPLLPSAPLFAGIPALRVPAALPEFCRTFSRRYESGPPATHDWKPRLREALEKEPRLRLPWPVQSRDEVYRGMVEDLTTARNLLRDRLGPQRGDAFCLPYACGSAAAVDAAREAGIRSCFWGVRADRRTNRPGDDPMHIVRIKHDFLYRLPAQGRRSLTAVYGAKLRRRLSRKPVY